MTFIGKQDLGKPDLAVDTGVPTPTSPALTALERVVRGFGLHTLTLALVACQELAQEEAPLDVALFGQFKSGKSSLLNALAGADLVPTGVLPVTAVITRIVGAERLASRVTFLDGCVQAIQIERIPDYVAEARNPKNERRVRYVDIETPTLSDLPRLRLVDTPGLGSVFAHNEQSTRDWLPHVAVAMVVTSSERPLSDDDRLLLAELRSHAPRVGVILSKIDLLSDTQRVEVEAFIRNVLARDGFASGQLILPFSTRKDAEGWISRLRNELLRPIAANHATERQRTLEHKICGLAKACREYLSVALSAAERTDQQREAIRVAVLNESVREDVISDELSLTKKRLIDSCRPTFEKKLSKLRFPLQVRTVQRAESEMAAWRGNLAVQRHRFESWLLAELMRELSGTSADMGPLADELVTQAHERFGRIVGAFRDRLSRNLNDVLGITLSPLQWQAATPRVTAPPIRIGHIFDIQVDLLWFLLPMRLLGKLFHRHFLGRISWEVEKNLSRLATDWSEAVVAVIRELECQALATVHGEIKMLARLLQLNSDECEVIRAALDDVSAIEKPQ